MRKFNIASINRAIKAAGIDAKLYRGNGYFYADGPDVAFAFSTSIYGVGHLSAFPVEWWVDRVRDMTRDRTLAGD